MIGRYAAPIFLGAFLLFQVQPLVARHLLPWFGGTPAVWTTCMLFFQLLLLLGYAYAHVVATVLKPRTQAAVQGTLLLASLVVLALCAFRWGVPLLPDAGWRPTTTGFPVGRILAILAVAVGLPYLVVATTSPLLQSWFGRTHPGRSPYRLYMLSNVGSLLALLTYPFVVEPALALKAQALVWAGGYVVFVIAYAVCMWQMVRTAELPSSPAPVAAAEAPAELTTGRVAAWVGLPALASVLLLATTNQMCQEVAVIPFLWVLPLSLYLLTFIITFDNPKWYSRAVYLPLMLLAVPAAAWLLRHQEDRPIQLQVGLYAVVLFVCCMVCHGELVARKPSPRHLTAFYLSVSIGGAVGGLFVGLLAPLVFSGFWEFPVALALCWLLGLATLWVWRGPRRDLRRAVTVGLIGATLVLPAVLTFRADPRGDATFVTVRNFYGVFRVRGWNTQWPHEFMHLLVHGRILHGAQYWEPGRRREPTCYYGRTGGLGRAMLHHPRRLAPKPADRSLRVGVLGLGAGCAAMYGQKGDVMRFYEINPDIERIARDTRYFSFLADCPSKIDVVLGDGRLSMEQELVSGGSQQLDLLIMEAFSSDSVPVHLLTKEAFAVYLAHLRQPDGVLVFNISNRVLDLKPVVWGLADYYGLGVALIADDGNGLGTSHSDYMLLTRSQRFLRQPQIAAAATPRPPMRHVRLWTDDFCSLLQVVK